MILALAMSAVSLYYYLQVLKQIYVAEMPADAAAVQIPMLSQVVLALLALGVVALGCAPEFLISKLLSAIQIAGGSSL